METKININLDRFNRSILDENHGIELLYNGQTLNDIEFVNDEDARHYNYKCNELELGPLNLLKDLEQTVTSFHNEQQSKWFIPEHYKTLDIEEYISKKLPKDISTEAINRVSMELEMYRTRNLYPILQVLIYIIDTMRKHDIVWGVGRGSSVASYVLYILGIHKVDSLKYNLDIKEFLKDE